MTVAGDDTTRRGEEEPQDDDEQRCATRQWATSMHCADARAQHTAASASQRLPRAPAHRWRMPAAEQAGSLRARHRGVVMEAAKRVVRRAEGASEAGA